MARITLAGESLIAQKVAELQPLEIARFIFANIPDLDPLSSVDRSAAKPPADQIMHTAEIPDSQRGYVDPNQVVYSCQLGSDIGDWDFNWIGLESAEGVLFAVVYVPLQQKRRNIPPLQIGNNVTRNFLVEFDGAMELTEITIDARTWQHDFTVRLASVDERERLSNRDLYGRACFFGSALKLEKVGTDYQVAPGTAYIEGIRVDLATALPITPPRIPGRAWLDVTLKRDLNDVVAAWAVAWGDDLTDHKDSVHNQHYMVPLANLPSSTVIEDQRTVEPIKGPLVTEFARHDGDYERLRARATTKADVGLGTLPNAKSDDPANGSSEVLATTAAVKKLVDGSQPVGKANQLTNPQKINGVDFDGSKPITVADATKVPMTGAMMTGAIHTSYGTDTRSLKVVRDVASYATTETAVTQALKVTLPFSWTSTMLRIVIVGYDYTNKGGWQLTLAGYTYAGGAGNWANASAMTNGTSTPFTSVQFGHDGKNCCIVLNHGGLSIPSIRIAEVMVCYNNTQLAWNTDWRLAPISSAAGITISTTPTINNSTNADLLDGQHGAFYLNASNMNAGTLPTARLAGTYNININGTASTAFPRTVDRNLGTGENLNYLTTSGWWHQSGNAAAASGSNYPVAEAGKLAVFNVGAGYIYQTYHTYNNSGYYVRACYNGTWYPWRKMWDQLTLKAPTASFANPGWWRCNQTGLIRQRGITARVLAGGNLKVTFPVAFTRAPVVTLGALSSTADASPTPELKSEIIPVLVEVTTTYFVFYARRLSGTNTDYVTAHWNAEA